jgi:hypothetical protein
LHDPLNDEDGAPIIQLTEELPEVTLFHQWLEADPNHPWLPTPNEIAYTISAPQQGIVGRLVGKVVQLNPNSPERTRSLFIESCQMSNESEPWIALGLQALEGSKDLLGYQEILLRSPGEIHTSERGLIKLNIASLLQGYWGHQNTYLPVKQAVKQAAKQVSFGNSEEVVALAFDLDGEYTQDRALYLRPMSPEKLRTLLHSHPWGTTLKSKVNSLIQTPIHLEATDLAFLKLSLEQGRISPEEYKIILDRNIK